MIQAIIRWLADHLGIALINWAHPELKAQVDALIAARDAQTIKDRQTEADVAQTETKVIQREAEIEGSQQQVNDTVKKLDENATRRAEEQKNPPTGDIRRDIGL